MHLTDPNAARLVSLTGLAKAAASQGVRGARRCEAIGKVSKTKWYLGFRRQRTNRARGVQHCPAPVPVAHVCPGCLESLTARWSGPCRKLSLTTGRWVAWPAYRVNHVLAPTVARLDVRQGVLPALPMHVAGLAGAEPYCSGSRNQPGGRRGRLPAARNQPRIECQGHGRPRTCRAGGGQVFRLAVNPPPP